VTVRLVRVSDGASLWADTFDESFTNIFGVQDSISERIARALELKLTGEEKKLLVKRHTENAKAYQAYLKGRFYWSKWRPAALKKAIEHFEQALNEDPSFALAYSGLADSYHLLGYLGASPPKEVYPKSEETALKALAIDESLGEAHLSLAKKKLFYDWDLPGTEREVKRAFDLNPNISDAHSFYGAYLLALGKFDEALRERKRAEELDPVTPLAVNSVGWVYYYSKRYDLAIEEYKRALDLDPNFILAHYDLANAYHQKGMYAEAVDEFLKHKASTGWEPESIAELRQAYLTSGVKGYWKKELDLATEQSRHGPVGSLRMARIYTELSDKARALEYLEKACDERSSLLIFIKVIPHFESLHSEARFLQLQRRIGLVP
jgi:tetratricopeptide (TPR) repeat protein